VHILFTASPVTMLSKFIACYKSASSRIIKQEFEHIHYFLWKNNFWSNSYCLLSTGGAPINIIKQYIENQGKLC
jgi:putative transposase